MSVCPHIQATFSICLPHIPSGYFALSITTRLLVILHSVNPQQLKIDETKGTGNSPWLNTKSTNHAADRDAGFHTATKTVAYVTIF